MSTRVPTRTTTVTVRCPAWLDELTECDAPMEVHYTVSGRDIPATRWEPAEQPVVVVGEIPVRCRTCGREYDADELRAIEEAARQAVWDRAEVTR